MLTRYDCPEIRKIWEEDSKYLYWYKIESAFLRNLRGIHTVTLDSFLPEWIEEIYEIEQVTKHDVAAFVQWMENFISHKIGTEARFVHYGLTSSDIVDTAFSMMIRDSNEIIINLSNEVISILSYFSEIYKIVEILGRTHGQAAEKISLGNKFNCYQEILGSLIPYEDTYHGRLAGSVGDYKYFDVRKAHFALCELELGSYPLIDGQIIHRSVYAKYMNEWALLASSIAKIATDIRLLSQSGICEMSEGFSKGQMGSSSMPQKKNPILCENLCGLARVIRGYQMTAMQNIELFLERDISHSSAERIIFPDAAILLGFMLKRLKNILENLQINEEAIKRNLDVFRESINAQERMLKLIENGMSRTEAHKKIKEEIIE